MISRFREGFLGKNVVEPTKAIYDKVKGKNVDTSIFVSNYSNIDNLNELIQKYKGIGLHGVGNVAKN